MPFGWRLLKTKHVSNAWDGEGARLYGGRWNSPRTRVVYTSDSLALAVLEVLVHLKESEILSAYSAIRANFEADLITTFDEATLPDRWRAHPSPPDLAAFGDRWAQSRSSAVLRVPSAVIPLEYSYVINPEHPDFETISFGRPIPFQLDYRLLERPSRA